MEMRQSEGHYSPHIGGMPLDWLKVYDMKIVISSLPLEFSLARYLLHFLNHLPTG